MTLLGVDSLLLLSLITCTDMPRLSLSTLSALDDADAAFPKCLTPLGVALHAVTGPKTYVYDNIVE